MLLLPTISDKISLGISPAVTLHIHASYLDAIGTVVTPGRKNTITTVETYIDIVDPPAASTERSVKMINIRNSHASASTTVNVVIDDGTTPADIAEVTLLAGETLSYTEIEGFVRYDANGALET